MQHSLRTFKQMPTSASRRVWEGKAFDYSLKSGWKGNGILGGGGSLRAGDVGGLLRTWVPAEGDAESRKDVPTGAVDADSAMFAHRKKNATPAKAGIQVCVQTTTFPRPHPALHKFFTLFARSPLRIPEYCTKIQSAPTTIAVTHPCSSSLQGKNRSST